jgi:pilus assembly protein Flp/PilA
MQRLSSWLMDFLRREDGPTAVEYAIMMALIIVVCIVSLTGLGGNTTKTYSYVGTQVGKTGS